MLYLAWYCPVQIAVRRRALRQAQDRPATAKQKPRNELRG